MALKKFNSIHIFGYGEAQITGKDLNYKSDVSGFSKINALITAIKAKRPENIADSDYHVIHIIPGVRLSYISKEQDKSFDLKISDIAEAKINDLVTEFETKKAEADSQPAN